MQGSTYRAKKRTRFCHAGDYETAGREARAAHAAAEAAFSHPAILAQLSFPDSHKLGVRL